MAKAESVYLTMPTTVSRDTPLSLISHGHDIVVIGGSAGSFAVIKQILKALPADLPAAIFIVTHIGASARLLTIIDGGATLPIKEAVSAEAIRHNQVYLAVPDAHLLVHGGHVMVRRGPRENFARPAIDPLFRSAAASFGGRVIGVLLSGGLDDGVAGLTAIKRCGGLVVVQDPSDAEVPSMPESALRAVKPDHCVASSEISTLLVALVRQPAAATPAIPSEIQFEVAISAREAIGMDLEDHLGARSPFTCPDCDGVLWQVHDESVLRFRCHVGHAVTAAALLEGKSTAVDDLLWRLLRTHQERAAIVRKMAVQALSVDRGAAAAAFEKRAIGYDEDASIVEELLSQMPKRD